MTQQKKTSKIIKIENALYVVATPIGNLSDITYRAIEILSNCDVILCENPKNSYNLLKFYNIDSSKINTYNDHSNAHQRQKILNLLQSKKSVALISDAGTPLISDPGYKLISFLRLQQQKIIPIAGASSLTAAISCCGLACDNFTFLGFLPNLKSKRQNIITNNINNSFVFFESARNLIKHLDEIYKIIGNRNCCIAREISKIHEEFCNDTISNLIGFFSEQKQKLKGEFVVIVEKPEKNQEKLSKEQLIKEIKKLYSKNFSLKDIVKNITEIYSINKKEIYQEALKIIK